MTVAGPELLSVVIPTLDEEEHVGKALASAARDPNVELIVVDGSSGDRTREIAAEHGARVLLAPRGRPGQMNRGAEEARGSILLFLHADTLLPPDYGQIARAFLEDGTTALGAFLHSFDSQAPWHRFIAWTVNLRSLYLKVPYGDQAIFLRRDLFRELGGYDDLPILEELDLIRRAGRHGKIRMARPKIVTSARRGRRQGEIRTTLANDVLLAGHFLRVPARKLLPIYQWIVRTSRYSEAEDTSPAAETAPTGKRPSEIR